MIGHIHKAEFAQHPVPDATDAEHKFGLMVIVHPEDAKAIPGDLIMCFFGWGDPEFVTFMEKAGGNFFTLLGMAIEFERNEEGHATNMRPNPSLPTNYPEMDYQRKLRQFRERLKEDRGRRYEACNALNTVRSVIENLECDEAKRNELTNLSNVLLRMILIENDGQVSPQKLQAF